MLSLLLLTAVVSLASAIVCPHDYCEHVTQPELSCKGNIIQHAGFCACYNICAKVEGESCTITHFRGVPNTAICDTGLVCSVIEEGGFSGRCVKAKEVTTTTIPAIEFYPNEAKRALQCSTPCQRKSLHCAISMIVYKGQWFARCDAEGNFLPEQCDNTDHCFCVDATGHVVEGTKVLGSATC